MKAGELEWLGQHTKLMANHAVAAYGATELATADSGAYVYVATDVGLIVMQDPQKDPVATRLVPWRAVAAEFTTSTMFDPFRNRRRTVPEMAVPSLGLTIKVAGRELDDDTKMTTEFIQVCIKAIHAGIGDLPRSTHPISESR